jgi:hypothetical protein
MPSFVSIDGKCYAAKEKAVDIRTGEIYEGPDREAIKFIAQENGISIEEAIKTNAFIGMSASEDPEMFEVAKKHGFNSVEEYLKAKKPSAKDEKVIKAAREKVVTHQPDKPKPGVDSGTRGGFYDPSKNESPETEFLKKG